MSGRNPISSIRSASSRTTWKMWPRKRGASLDVVEHASRGADHDVDAHGEGLELPFDRLATVDAADYDILARARRLSSTTIC